MRNPSRRAIVDDMVCFSLYSAARATTRAYAEQLDPWGLTYPQYLVLVVLWTEGPTSVRELGRLLQLDSGTLSPLLRRMERKQLLARARDDEDQRVVTVTTTERGGALHAELAHLPAIIAEATGLPDESSARELIDTLHRLATAMSEAPPAAPGRTVHLEEIPRRQETP